MKRVNVISMGCSKNLVDSERLLRRLSDGAIETVHDGEPEAPADAVVINTCGFIGDAKEESIDMILRACEAKKNCAVGAVYVMGCLSERYAADLPAEIPEVDAWYGKFDFEDLAARLCRQPAPARTWERRLTTPPWSAYLKIAEGCNRFCAFCAIPLITGRYKSRPVEEILDEVTTLAAEGVVEFNVIAQDLSFYGRDLYGEPAIARLVDAMAAVPGVRWIRLHYAYPSDFPYDLLPVMARHANVCKYLDIALQHSADGVLDRMRRHISGDQQRALLARIRREVPGIHIRTTLMTGFPGETDEDFDELLRFVRTERFERMGAFAYCEEDDTYAATHYADDVPEEVKQQRLDRLMAVQEEIALEHNEAKIGTRMTVLVEGDDGEEFYRARSKYDSPEVDPEVLIARDSCPAPLVPGTFCEVEITDALPYELIAKAV